MTTRVRYNAPAGSPCDVCGRQPKPDRRHPGRWRTERRDPEGFGTVVFCNRCARLSVAQATRLVLQRREYLRQAPLRDKPIRRRA